MSIPVLIMGESGTGKSTSFRNFTKDEVDLINVQGKPLPFRGDYTTFVTKDFKAILAGILKSKKRAVIVDDFGYAITDYYARHSLGQEERDRDQYEVYKSIAAGVYELIDKVCRDGDASKVVYIVMHTERDAFGGVQPLTVGKLLNEKIKIVGMVTVCLLSAFENGRYAFKVNETPPSKSPMGMFDGPVIDNDLKAVDAAIRSYWNLQPLKNGEENESDQ